MEYHHIRITGSKRRYEKDSLAQKYPVRRCLKKIRLETDPKDTDGHVNINVPDDRFLKAYHVGSKLGSGGFGTVYSGYRRRDNLPVAIKHVLKEKVLNWGQLDGYHVPMEICLLKKVSQIDGVIKMIDWFEAKNGYVIVMERPEKVKDLFDYIDDKGVLDENTAKNFFRQILETVIDIHNAGVLHRDLKTENILVDLITGELKLIDFGCGALLQDALYFTLFGTALYSPPEWFLHHCYHGIAAAVWSLGILLYYIVCGDYPFTKTEKITKAEFDFKKSTRTLSLGVQDLIRKCLSLSASDRPSLQELFKHPWMADGVHSSNHSKNMVTSIRNNDETDSVDGQSISSQESFL